MTPAALQQYRNVQVTTASQGTLIVMLYDGLLRSIAQAEGAIQRREVESAHNALLRAHGIVSELAATLNPAAGEISGSLLRLYDFMADRIVQANVHKDPQWLKPVGQIAAELRSAWAEAARIAATQALPVAQSR